MADPAVGFSGSQGAAEILSKNILAGIVDRAKLFSGLQKTFR